MSLVLAALAAALAAQTPELSADREPGIIYRPFAGEAADARLRIRIEDAPDGATLIAEPSAGAPLVFTAPGAPPLPYRLSTDEGTAAGTDDRLVVPLAPDGDAAAEAVVRLVVDAGPVVPPGTYDAALDLRVAAPDGTVLTELLTVSTAIEVAARAQVVLAGTSGAFDPQSSVGFVDFGTLETGETRRLFVAVRANTQTLVTVTSENAGRMTLRGEERAAAPDAPGVSYTVDLDGTVSDLAVPLEVVRAPPLTAAGAAYPFVITIGDVSTLFAGTYRDDIVIDVRPQ